MASSKRKMSLIVALLIAACVGFIVIQAFWIKSSYNNEEQKFYSNVKIIGIQLQNIIESSPKLKNGLINLSKNQNPDSRKIKFYKNRLSEISDSLFKKRNTNIAFEFGLVRHNERQNDCCHLQKINDEQIVFSTSTEVKKLILTSDYHTCASSLDGFAHLNFYYPNLDFYLLSKIGNMILLSIICMVIVSGCFLFTFRTLRKQNKLVKMKNDFINNITHEFKTPIFSISVASNALSRSLSAQNSEKLQKYLSIIDHESNRLKSQVNKILQLRLMDCDDANLKIEQIDLHRLIKKNIESFEARIAEQNGSIEVNLNAEKHIIRADLTHISNVLTNLIDNAIKYSKDEPHIKISTADTENGIRFNIDDYGIGMDAETRKHIFDKFYRAQTGDITNTDGFGLGLSYVKNIIEAHKGWIKLRSKIGKGSTFTIFLPN